MNADNKRLGGVYQIFNKTDGRSYIGSAKYIKRRFAQHRHALRRGRKTSVPLARAWGQFGEHVFEFITLEVIEDIHRLKERESFWIAKFKSADPMFGYNIAPDATTNRGFKKTAEQRAAMSASRKGKPPNRQTIAKIVAKTTGQKRTPETRARMRAAQKVRFDAERLMVAAYVCAHFRYNPILAMAN